MAPQTLTHTGTMTGYQSVGDEVRADAGTPHASSFAGSAMSGPQFRFPDQSLEKQAQVAEKSKDRAEQPDDDDGQPGDSSPHTVTVTAPGPSYGGAAYNDGGGQLANDMSHPAIEPGPKVIPGTIEA